METDYKKQFPHDFDSHGALIERSRISITHKTKYNAILRELPKDYLDMGGRLNDLNTNMFAEDWGSLHPQHVEETCQLIDQLYLEIVAKEVEAP